MSFSLSNSQHPSFRYSASESEVRFKNDFKTENGKLAVECRWDTEVNHCRKPNIRLLLEPQIQ